MENVDTIFINTLLFLNTVFKNEEIKISNNYKDIIKLFKKYYHINFTNYYKKLKQCYYDYNENYEIEIEIDELRIPEIRNTFYSNTKNLIDLEVIKFYLKNELLFKYLTFKYLEFVMCDLIITYLIPSNKTRLTKNLRLI
jgi:hypothetical protein